MVARTPNEIGLVDNTTMVLQHIVNMSQKFGILAKALLAISGLCFIASYFSEGGASDNIMFAAMLFLLIGLAIEAVNNMRSASVLFLLGFGVWPIVLSKTGISDWSTFISLNKKMMVLSYTSFFCVLWAIYWFIVYLKRGKPS